MRALGVLTAAAVLISLTAPPVAASTGDYVPPPIEWGACAKQTLATYGVQCGFVEVPLDYAHPDGTKIRLAVSRLRHGVPDAQYQGVMLTNPGGPGGQGLVFSLLGFYIPGGAGAAYDWIGFDPRGVGASEPSLTCGGAAGAYNRPAYVPTTRQLWTTWTDASRSYAQACGRAGGELLNHLKTTDSVADMESIRKALGQEQINYYGFSYGTYLGQVYATLHPDRLRRMVLDGTVDPRGVWYRANLRQDVGFDQNITKYFQWIADHDDRYQLGATGSAVEKRYYAELRKLATAPAGGVIGPDELTDVFLLAGYFVFGWAQLADAFASWVHDGDWQALKALYDGSADSDNAHAVYLGVECTDAAWPSTRAQWAADNWLVHAKAPFDTWGNAWFNAPCLDWPARAGKPVSVNGATVAPILLVGETYDAATPFEGSLEVRDRFPQARLIEGVGGTTHAGSLNGVACVDGRIAAYLATGALPDRVPGRVSDVQCDPIPRPEPAPALTARSSSTFTADTTGLPDFLRDLIAVH